MSKITVITPVYNCQNYLSQSIESVLSQSFKDFKYIIWDDGSEDNSINIAKEYETIDKRIAVVEAKHQGLSKSLKQCLETCKTPYFGIVDSDDLLHQDALLKTLQVIEKERDCGIVYTSYQNINESGSSIGLGSRCKIPYSKQQLLVSFMTFHFRLINRKIYLQSGGYDDTLSCAQDYDLCLKISEISNIIHLNRCLYSYRKHSQSYTAQNQLESVKTTQKIIQSAITRRLIKDFRLNVEVTARFSLQKIS
jgi:glycosyltransferase involved in cell wall biosynthesis